MAAVVDPDLYDEQYYLANNIGHDEFLTGLDKAPIHPKYKSVLDHCHFSSEKTVLDIGCGRGELVYYAARSNCKKAVGIDYSSTAIHIANSFKDKLPPELRKRMHFFHKDAAELPDRERYDYIFMVEVWEHMYDHQIELLLKKLSQILKDDGLFILTTPNGLYEKYLYPVKRITNIPFNIFKFPLRILRGKWKPASFSDLLRHIFKVQPFSNVFLDKTHVNISSAVKIQRMLKSAGLASKVFCSDSSKNLLSLLFARWAGREMLITAQKGEF